MQTWLLKLIIQKKYLYHWQKKFGINLEMHVERRGFFPEGGGIVTLKTHPVSVLQPIYLENRGKIKDIHIYTFCSGSISKSVSHRMVYAALTYLKNKLKGSHIEYAVSACNETPQKPIGDGIAILIVALSSTGCRLAGSKNGENGNRAEIVGTKAAKELIMNIDTGGCVDEYVATVIYVLLIFTATLRYLQDQLIIYMGLAFGRSRVLVGPISQHTTSAIYYTQMLTGAKFSITKATRNNLGDTNWIECDGMSYSNPYLKSQ